MEENERTDAFASRKAIKRPSTGRDAFQEHGKLPPQAIDLEEAVLGALMLEKDAVAAVIDMLVPATFYKESHQSIFEKLTVASTNVELAKVALCDVDGPVEFYISDDNSTMNSIVNKYGRSIDVEGLCLKSLLDKYSLDKVDFCKIDIEGSEMRAVTVETLGAVFDRIDEIFIECHATVPNFTHGDIIANRVKMEEVFKKVGYQIKVVNFDTIHAFKG